MGDTIFQADCISYVYPGGQAALDNISLKIRAGEQVALLGANASGKSTLLRLLDGLLFPCEGRVIAFGEELSEQSLDGTFFGRFFRSQIAFLFQNVDAQLFCPTVKEELAFGPRHIGLSEKEIAHRIEGMVAMFRLEDVLDRSPQSLSGGEKRRVGLAAILAVGPSVVMLDEPTTGLDPRNRAFLMDTLIELSDAGKTIIVATHDLELAHVVASRGIVLSEDHQIAADTDIHGVLADVSLLSDVNLVHIHPHKHGDMTHVHPHAHSRPHEHDSDVH